ncbi:MAG: exodeoxyribonuclease VII large subunit [Candidatus Zixiibacteriota bacterium]|nr:MAG: exodeoxyribonuclease VII large subunit [candidate division Zixibacteria bacterium]
MIEQPKAYTISAVTRMIKTSMEEQFSQIWVEGEISNYHHHSSGHRYITLKDDRAVLKVVMWRSVGEYLKFEPENGQKVLAFGDITIYEKGGQYQLNCRKLVPVGVGELELAFRQLHEKLAAEGLFDEDCKQVLPAYPQRIGIVTSPTGAAIRDIIQIAQRRNPSVQLIVYPAKVQGDGAEETIAAGIEYFNSRDDIDIIIVGRGGGSLEDLWPFNTETTVRVIAASSVPVVSAVGHEIDITLSDLAADLRAPTPSAAAELTVWSLDEFTDRINDLVSLQANLLNSQLGQAREELAGIQNRPVFVRPLDIINQYRQQLDGSHRLLLAAGKNRLERYRNSLSLSLSRFEILSPLKTLARGYTVTRTSDNGKLVRSRRDVTAGDKLETVLTDGRLMSVVEEISDER